MKNFRESYRKAVDAIPVPEFVMREAAGRKQKIGGFDGRGKRNVAAAAVAGGMFVICALGGVAATGYAKSIIRTDENGFQTIDMRNALTQGGTEEAAFDGAQAEAAEQSEEKQSENKRSEEVLCPLTEPDASLVGGWTLKEYQSLGEQEILTRLEAGEKRILFHQYDYSGTEGHAFAISYAGGVENERLYTTDQGFTYKLVDSVEGGEIHAAVAVGDYELILDFSGFGEEETEALLESMDLTVYL